MDFDERLQALSDRIQQNSGFIENEEMTKNSLVLPFLQTLGYDPFNPQEVFPEYTADIGTKKGEKVDYAIMKEGDPIMLIECKTCNSNLTQCNATQLQRYFQATPSARIGVLTDGVEYHFYTDLDRANLMDEKPFMIFDFKTLEESLVPELKKLTKSRFDIEETLSAASELKYTRAIKKLFAQESHDPSDEFVRHFASQVYSGKLMPSVKEKFTELVKKALNLYINEVITDRLKNAMRGESDTENEVDEPTTAEPKSKIETTDDERDGYYIIKSILREVVEPERVIMRDTQSYCGILLDNNNRKPLCRLHFNTSQYYLGIILDADKNEERIPIDSLDDIYAHADRIRIVPGYYE
ncbi:MAG: type I restriction endonuclease [Pseudodesulfovibrio sp.]